MIDISGTLVVRLIKGRKGVFAVGDLHTDIGNFKVKDPLLDQFDEGQYRGTFQVVRIFPDSYIYYGRVVTEIRAQLAGYVLSEEDIRSLPDQPSIPDPVDQSLSPDTPLPSSPVPTAAPQPAPVATTPDAADADQALFGEELYPAVVEGLAIKLDPTVDRNVFRAQRDRLKTLGFRFEAASQTWKK